MRRIILGLVTLAALLLAGCAVQINPSAYPVEQYVARAETMTVKVLTDTGTGTGVFVSSTVVLTAKHVIRLFGQPGQIKVLVGTDTYDAAVLSEAAPTDNADMSHDWVLLQVEGYKSPYWATADCLPTQIGEQVFAIGYPLGKGQMAFLGNVVDPGFNIGQWTGQDKIWQHSILTTLMVAPGVSGGPVFDSDGDLIGITVGSLNARGQFGQVVYPVAYTPLCDVSDVHLSDRIRLDDPDMENPQVIRG